MAGLNVHLHLRPSLARCCILSSVLFPSWLGPQNERGQRSPFRVRHQLAAADDLVIDDHIVLSEQPIEQHLRAAKIQRSIEREPARDLYGPPIALFPYLVRLALELEQV